MRLLKLIYQMVNKSNDPIDSLHLNWGGPGIFHKKIEEFKINGKTPVLGKKYEDFGYEIYSLGNQNATL